MLSKPPPGLPLEREEKGHLRFQLAKPARFHDGERSRLFQPETLLSAGGEIGIRTLGGLPLNSFQDCRFRPLSHLSVFA